MSMPPASQWSSFDGPATIRSTLVVRAPRAREFGIHLPAPLGVATDEEMTHVRTVNIERGSHSHAVKPSSNPQVGQGKLRTGGNNCRSQRAL